MSTGNIDNYGGIINEIGPMYPFVGWEWLFVLFGIAFWLGWHIWQFRSEIKEYEDELKNHVNEQILSRVFEREEKNSGV